MVNPPEAGMPRALVLSPEAPYPLHGGGAIRTACLLQYLAQRMPVDLVTFAVGADRDPAVDLPDGLVDSAHTVRLPVHPNSLLAKVRRNSVRLLRGRLPLADRFGEPESLRAVEQAVAGRRYALAIVEHFWCAQYLPLLRPVAGQVVLNLHNVESELHETCSRSEPWPQNWAHGRFAGRARELEAEYLPKFDLILATSELDAERVRLIAPGSRVAVMPNAAPLRDAPEPPEENVVAFSGNLEYHPNLTAARYFARQVWPRLAADFGDLRWRLIGRNQERLQREFALDSRIEFTGPVEDAVMELARSRFAVVPVQSGSGTRVKIMEAWSAKRAVISTPLGAEGLPIREQSNILLADSPERWLVQARQLLQDEGMRRRMGLAGRGTFEEHLSWPAAWRALEGTLGTALPPLTGD